MAENGTLQIPEAEILPETDEIKCEYYFAGDAAFPLSTYLMKPYGGSGLPVEKKIFNYRSNLNVKNFFIPIFMLPYNTIFFFRLSRGRRLIENTFGIITAKWRLLTKSIELNLKNATLAVQAIVCLHNFLIDTCGPIDHLADREDANHNLIDGAWRNEIPGQILRSANMKARRANRNKKDADEMRETLTKYFNAEGAVEWQNRMINFV